MVSVIFILALIGGVVAVDEADTKAKLRIEAAHQKQRVVATMQVTERHLDIVPMCYLEMDGCGITLGSHTCGESSDGWMISCINLRKTFVCHPKDMDGSGVWAWCLKL